MASRRASSSGDRHEQEEHKGLPMHLFPHVRAYRAWLSKNHGRSQGIWVKLAKKGTGVPSLSYEDARDHAIAFGWIDGLRNAIDDTFYAIRCTPRKPRSKWSQVNRKVVEALIASDQMQEAGMLQVNAAKADGRWEAAYAGARTIEVPEDFALALKREPRAAEFFKTIKSAHRFAMLYRIHDAKRPETRARRIEKFVAMLKEGDVLSLF